MRFSVETGRWLCGTYDPAGAIASGCHLVVLLRARDTEHLERTPEAIREPPGVIRTQTQVVLSALLERPLAEG